MMNDLDLQRLRNRASEDPVLAAALEEIEDHRARLHLTPPLVVSGTQQVDDERWRNAGDDKARERVLWEGIARDMGKQMLEAVDCSIRAGSGLLTFSAAAVVLRPRLNMNAVLQDFGGFRVRLINDNRATTPPTTGPVSIDHTAAEDQT